MFRELTMEEKYETEGGSPTVIVKGIIAIIVIAVSGILKGCSNAAADDVRENSSGSVSSGDAL